MKKIVIRFGLLATAMLFLVQVSKYSLFTRNLSNEFWVGLFALVFLGFGIMISQIFFSQKESTPVVTTEKSEINHQKIQELGISNREYQVLKLIANGLSNQEIANQLFISESTVKTHTSNLFSKLDAKRRTQALTIARSLNIV